MRLFSRISNYWLCQLGGWGLIVFSMIFYKVGFRENLSFLDLARISVFFFGGIISTHLMRSYLKKKGWMQLSIEKMIPRLLLAIIVTSIFYSLIIILFFQVLAVKESAKDFTTRLTGMVLNTGLLITPWMLIYYFYHYIESSRRQQLNNLKLQSLVKELELKTIKSHINPHFIFNALNSIRALIDENPGRARDAITELSNILRSSMQAEKLETVPFERELNIVKDYLALEYIRFEDRLKVEYQIDEDTLDSPVPPMMLQTLVENAIKHGIGKEVKGGLIRIISDYNGRFHELIVQNPGILSDEIKGEGFGLSSTRNRLQLLFGTNSEFQITQESKNMVQVKVMIPVSIN
ncbi:MAG: histidine kinase [Chitinophagaceae bacterium]|uniref:sensor histidine kinase n=1 Tax=unclassified Paraflavitalea TaxID=2798305 RepID=UPI003D334C89|nr:histidine kinase [Chitinophagaceae bacterium]